MSRDGDSRPRLDWITNKGERGAEVEDGDRRGADIPSISLLNDKMED